MEKAALQQPLRALADFFLPRRCVVCGRPLGLHERHICLYCDADLPLTRFWTQASQPMADRYNARIQEYLQEERPERLEDYQYAAALFYYSEEAGYRGIPQALKYGGQLELGRHFAARLGALLAESPLWVDVDWVVPVPLHWLRRWRRGYNQAAVVAGEIARELNRRPGARVLLRTDVLRRRRHTLTQTRMSGQQKRRNVSGAFRARPAASGAPRHILLVDDVFTSGSTLTACHQALRAVFPPPVRISVATLAFVQEE